MASRPKATLTGPVPRYWPISHGVLTRENWKSRLPASIPSPLFKRHIASWSNAIPMAKLCLYPELSPYDLCSPGKPLSRAFSRLRGLFCAILRWRRRLQRIEQFAGDCRYLVNGGKECRLIGFRWLVDTAYLAHVL